MHGMRGQVRKTDALPRRRCRQPEISRRADVSDKIEKPMLQF